MAYWLFKTEPDTWSWQQQLDKKDEAEQWDGVRNYQARNYMSSMKVGDLGFFYHTGNEKKIVGIVRVSAPFHPDTTDASGKFGCVDVTAVASFVHEVSLVKIKSIPELSAMVLVKNSRLSVQPVSEFEWNFLCKLGGINIT